MRIAIVTGASSGLGKAFLAEWAVRGEDLDEVWLIARNKAQLEITALSLPWQARVIALDLSVAAQRDILADMLASARPQVQYLVNSAGYGKIGRVDSIKRADQTGMVDLNCTALVDVTQMVLPYLARGSVIFQVASVAAFLPQPEFAVYAATKAFVHSFSRALNVELADKGVRVVSVCPNPMDTAFFERAGTKPRAFKQAFFEAPARVAAKAMQAAARGQDVSTSCAISRSLRILAKAVPQRVILQAERRLLKYFN